MLARPFFLVAWNFRFRMRRVVSTWSMLVHAMGSVIAMAVVIQVLPTVIPGVRLGVGSVGKSV
jgi:hypothetical protein